MAKKHRIIPSLTAIQLDRFKASATVSLVSECLEWGKGTDKNGYGYINLGRAHYPAHRVAYFLAHGEQPAEMLVCHKCDNPKCVLPAHLFLGTPKDNTDDMVRKGRSRFTINGTFARGERQGSSKLTEIQVREILTSDQTGASLARKFGVSKALVCMIRRGLWWKHVSAENKAIVKDEVLR